MIRILIAAAIFWAALTLQQQRGREIYRRGTVDRSPIGTTAIGPDGIPLPSSSFACATCHGTWGEGTREGGIEPPPLNWKRLTSPAVSSVTGRRRAAYTAETLRSAITAGIDPSGKRLHPAMPRYTIPEEHLTELLAYLERCGDEDDTDPGVTSNTIRIGAALPLTGPLQPAGESIRDTLQLLFAHASREGGIYGRSLELVVEDSHGTESGLLDATRRLVSEDHIFAMASNFGTNSTRDLSHLLETAEVPLIGPVASSPHGTTLPNPYVFYLLPSLYDQARAIVDFVARRDVHHLPRLAVIRSATTFDQDIADGIRAQAAIQGLQLFDQGDAGNSVTAALATQPDYLVFTGDGPGLARLAQQLDQTNPSPVLVGFISTAQSGLAQLPPAIAARALFAAPALPPDTREASAFFSLLQDGHSPRNYLGLRTAAYAAGTVLIQALRSSGNPPDRDSMVRSLEHLQHFETGVVAPLSFSPNQRVGSIGGVILDFDPVSHDFVAISGWITPGI